MRTDARIGLAIGGILLLVVVLFVWFGTGRSTAPVELTVTQPGGVERGDRQRDFDRPVDPLGDLPTPPVGDPFASANAPMAAQDEPAAGRSAEDWVRILETGVIMNAASQRQETALAPTNSPAAVTDAGSSSLPRSSDADLFRPPTPGQRFAERAGEPASAPPSDQPPIASGARTHTVKSGETFSSIAAAVYGSANYYPHIMRANPDVNERGLRPGMVLRLPDPSQVRVQSSQTTETAQPAIDARREYRVQENDSLYRISMRLYGKPDRIDEIYQLNREQIGPDPNRLRLNMVLKLPEPPARVQQ